MGKHTDKVMGTHWAKCWMEHHECFWRHCIILSRTENTTAEYQAFKYFKLALGGDYFYILRRDDDDDDMPF